MVIIILTLTSIYLEVFSMAACADIQQTTGRVGKEILKKSLSGRAKSISWSPDGKVIAIAEEKKIQAIDITSNQISFETDAYVNDSAEIAFASDAVAITPVSGKANDINARYIDDSVAPIVSVIDIDKGDIQQILEKKDGSAWPLVTAFCISPNKKTVAVALDYSGLIKIVDLKDKSIVRVLGPFINHHGNTSGLIKIKYSSSGDKLYGGYIDGEIIIWDIASNNLVRSFAAYKAGLTTIVVDQAYGALVSAGSGVMMTGKVDEPSSLVRLWDSKTGDLIRSYEGTLNGIVSLDVSPNGRFIAAMEGGPIPGMNLILWDAQSGRLLGEISYGRHEYGALAFSPDSRTLAVSVDKGLQLLQISQ